MSAIDDLSETTKDVNAVHIKELVENYHRVIQEPVFLDLIQGMPDDDNARGELFDMDRMVASKHFWNNLEYK